jgi:carboxyl-terminal processing protease
MRKKIITLLAVIVVVLGLALVVSNALPQQDKHSDLKNDYYREIEQFANVLSIVQSDYVDAEKIEPKKLIYGALEGMLSKLDSHSQFMEPDEFKEMKMETEGQFGGLGIEISIKDGLLTIVAPIEGTPAAKAGISPGDRIVKIDGKSTKDIKLNEAVKRLRGRPGTDANITVLREEEKKLLDFTITRALIKIESVKEARIIDPKDKIGYIKLIEFQEKTAADLDAALARLKSEGMQSLILDLRNNPGGLLDVAVSVSERFIPSGQTIVSTKGRLADQNTVFKSQGRDLYTGFPMVVLVNRGSASASEILAGAIQDTKRGIIMGTRTFGKGSVQTVIPLRDGSAVRLTTAKYYTPANKTIQGEGIIPDVVVEKEKVVTQKENDIFDQIELMANRPKETRIEFNSEKQQYDSQLARAIDLLKGIKAYKGFLEAK